MSLGSLVTIYPWCTFGFLGGPLTLQAAATCLLYAFDNPWLRLECMHKLTVYLSNVNYSEIKYIIYCCVAAIVKLLFVLYNSS